MNYNNNFGSNSTNSFGNNFGNNPANNPGNNYGSNPANNYGNNFGPGLEKDRRSNFAGGYGNEPAGNYQSNFKPEYEILYNGAFPIVKYKLRHGERIKAEADAMIAMSSTVDVTGGVEGGFMRGLTRMLAGEKFFFQYLTAARGAGEVLFGHAIPGGIVDVELDGSYGLRVQKDGFLAATEGVQVDTKMQNLVQGLFSKEGLFILNITGRGIVFLSSYGAIHPINLGPGEEIIIDNGHLVAWADYMQYTIERASNGWMNSIMSGECLVCRFRGPGIVLIQTRNPGSFKSWLTSMGFTTGR